MAATATMAGAPSYPPPLRRWLTIAATMAAAFVPTIDATIANVALPHMQAALSATPDSIAWVLTSYVLTLAISTPVTGWLESRIGRRLLFTLAIAGFTIASAACGAATSLTMMVIARAAQGMFGAFVAPLAQATMLDISPPEKHAQAMTIWGGGVMIAPIIGPVIGGWLTDDFGWRWVFLVNLPIGVIATASLWLLIRDGAPREKRFDMFGYGLLAVGLASLQLMLDRGSQLDWFAAAEIWIEGGITLACFWMLIVHTVTASAPMIPRALFQDRNFVLATGFSMVATALLLSLSALIAPMLQRLMGYDAIGAGMMMLPRGFGGLLSMIVAGRLAGKVDPRFLIAGGFIVSIAATHMLTGLDLASDARLFSISGALQGFAIGLTFMPLNLMAFTTVPADLRTEAASFYNLARNMAGSVMISVTAALLVRNVQVSHSDLVSQMSPAVQGAQQIFPMWPADSVAGLLDAEVNRQALMIAYLDDYALMTWLAILALSFIPFLHRPKRQAAPSAEMMVME